MVNDKFGSKPLKDSAESRLRARQLENRARRGNRTPPSGDAIDAVALRAGAPPRNAEQPIVGGTQERKKENVFYPAPLSAPEINEVLRVFKEREGNTFDFTAREVLSSFTNAPMMETISRWSFFTFTDDSDTKKDGAEPYINKKGYHGVRLRVEGARIENGQISVRMYLHPLFTFVDELGRPWLYDASKGPESGKDEVYTQARANIPKFIVEQAIFCGALIYNADGALVEDNNDLI